MKIIMDEDEFILVLKSDGEVIGVIKPNNEVMFYEACKNLYLDGVDEILIMNIQEYDI